MEKKNLFGEQRYVSLDQDDIKELIIRALASKGHKGLSHRSVIVVLDETIPGLETKVRYIVDTYRKVEQRIEQPIKDTQNEKQ